jgi:hypothetical protein
MDAVFLESDKAFLALATNDFAFTVGFSSLYVLESY